MKTQELRMLLAQTDAASSAAWDKYKAAEASIQPFKQEWLSLFNESERLRTRLSVMEEMEREASELQSEKEAA